MTGEQSKEAKKEQKQQFTLKFLDLNGNEVEVPGKPLTVGWDDATVIGEMRTQGNAIRRTQLTPAFQKAIQAFNLATRATDEDKTSAPFLQVGASDDYKSVWYTGWPSSTITNMGTQLGAHLQKTEATSEQNSNVIWIHLPIKVTEEDAQTREITCRFWDNEVQDNVTTSKRVPLSALTFIKPTGEAISTIHDQTKTKQKVEAKVEVAPSKPKVPEKRVAGFNTAEEGLVNSDHLAQLYTVQVPQAQDAKEVPPPLKILGWNIYAVGSPGGYGDFEWPGTPDDNSLSIAAVQKKETETDTLLASELARMDRIAELAGTQQADVICFQETPKCPDTPVIKVGVLQSLSNWWTRLRGTDEQKRLLKNNELNIKIHNAQWAVFSRLQEKMLEKGYDLVDREVGKNLLTFTSRTSQYEVVPNTHTKNEIDMANDSRGDRASISQTTIKHKNSTAQIRVANVRLNFCSSPQPVEDEFIIERFRSSKIPVAFIADVNRGVLSANGDFELTNKVPESISSNFLENDPGTFSYDSTDTGVLIAPGKNPITLSSSILDMRGQILAKPATSHDQQGKLAQLRHLVVWNDPFLHYLREINAAQGIDVFYSYDYATKGFCYSFVAPTQSNAKPTLGVAGEKTFNIQDRNTVQFQSADIGSYEPRPLFTLDVMSPVVKETIAAYRTALNAQSYSTGYYERRAKFLEAKGPAVARSQRPHFEGAVYEKQTDLNKHNSGKTQSQTNFRTELQEFQAEDTRKKTRFLGVGLVASLAGLLVFNFVPAFTGVGVLSGLFGTSLIAFTLATALVLINKFRITPVESAIMAGTDLPKADEQSRRNWITGGLAVLATGAVVTLTTLMVVGIIPGKEFIFGGLDNLLAATATGGGALIALPIVVAIALMLVVRFAMEKSVENYLAPKTRQKLENETNSLQQRYAKFRDKFVTLPAELANAKQERDEHNAQQPKLRKEIADSLREAHAALDKIFASPVTKDPTPEASPNTAAPSSQPRIETKAGENAENRSDSVGSLDNSIKSEGKQHGESETTIPQSDASLSSAATTMVLLAQQPRENGSDSVSSSRMSTSTNASENTSGDGHRTSLSQEGMDETPPNPKDSPRNAEQTATAEGENLPTPSTPSGFRSSANKFRKSTVQQPKSISPPVGEPPTHKR